MVWGRTSGIRRQSAALGGRWNRRPGPLGYEGRAEQAPTGGDRNPAALLRLLATFSLAPAGIHRHRLEVHHLGAQVGNDDAPGEKGATSWVTSRKTTRKDGSIRWYARYLGADGRYHEEGDYPSKLAAAKAAAKKEVGAGGGDWVDPAAGRMTFAEYVRTRYWPSTDHLEVSTRAGYSYHLDKHFLPRFGALPMRRITPAVIQSWVNDATAGTLSARSVRALRR
jgi:hypothetical protein